MCYKIRKSGFQSPLLIHQGFFKIITILCYHAYQNENTHWFHLFIIIHSLLYCHVPLVIILYETTKEPILLQCLMSPLITVHLNQQIPFNILNNFTLSNMTHTLWYVSFNTYLVLEDSLSLLLT